MTKIECQNEDLWEKCKYLENGICTKEVVEMEYRLETSESTEHIMVCASAEIIPK